jgi:hypothetical protein
MEAMVCIPGQIREGKSEEEYAEFKSLTDTTADRKRRCVVCEICSASLTAGSYQSHLKSQHDVFRSVVLQQDIVVEHPAMVYRAIKLLAVGKYFCPVPHCVGNSSTKWNLRRHFLDPHPQDFVVIPSKGTVPYPKCKRCGMQTKPGTLLGWHQQT